MTQEDRNPSGYFYESEAINWWFFGSSLLLLLSIVWMVWYDWRGFRQWKGYQEEFRRIEAELARKAGLSPLTIDRVESGMDCRMDTKRKIILALGYKLSEKDKVFPCSVT